jgi:hypothetical protein
LNNNDGVKPPDFTDLESIDSARYEGIDHDRLLAYVVKRLEELSIPVTFENVTVAAFRTFPVVFSLNGYPEYPDAARVNRTLLHGGPKYKNYLVGRATTGYELSERGRAAANDAYELIRNADGSRRFGRAARKRLMPARTVNDRMEREVRESGAFQLWKSNAIITPESFYVFLHLLPGSPKEAVKENYKAMRRLLQGSEDLEIASFFKTLSDSFKKELD